jgi:DNA replication licensing factor MCM6
VRQSQEPTAQTRFVLAVAHPRTSLTISQITPDFVREAYTLLRQSIIHVEQDDIDFDEEDTQTNGVKADGVQDSQDIEMSAADYEALDRIESSHNESMGLGDSSTLVGSGGVGSSSQDVPVVHKTVATKKKMTITHDKFISLRSLIVLHLAAALSLIGRGLEKEELIDWYLELKESEVQDLDELEQEKELITKMLRKLVKVICDIFAHST